MPLIYAKGESAEWCERAAVVPMGHRPADGDSRRKANFIVGSPLALAFATRVWPATGCRMDGRDDLRHGLHAPHRRPDVCYATVVAYAYILGNRWGAALRRFRVARDRGMPYGLPNDPVTIRVP